MICGWNFKDQGRVLFEASGNCNELLTAKDITQLSERENPVTIKDSQRWADVGFEKSGYVTYVMEINNLSYDNPGLLIDQFFGQHKTDFYYQDETGQLVQVSMPMVGSVGPNEESTDPQFRKSVMKLPGNITKGWLVIQQSDYLFDGMLRKVPIIGDYESIYQREFTCTLGRFFILGSFFLLLVTNFSLFLQRNDDKARLHYRIRLDFSLLFDRRTLANCP